MRRFLALACFSLLSVHAEEHLVVPFFNLSKSPNLDWIGVSIAEALGAALAGARLEVTSRGDRAEAFRRLGLRPAVPLTKASIVKLGQTAGAARVVFGQFEVLAAQPETPARSGSLRITARVIDLQHVRQGPEFSQIGALQDLATLETHLAWQTLQQVAPAASPSQAEYLRLHPAAKVEAIESYMRGLLAAPEQQHRFFTEAARLDPAYVPPQFELGKMQWEKKSYSVAAGWLEKVPPAYARALEAGFLLSLCRYHAGDYAGALAALEPVARAVSSHEVINNLGAMQSRLGRPEALASFRRALEGDALDPDYHFNLGYALWRQGDFDQAADRFRAVLDRKPDDAEAILFLGRSLKRSGPRAGDPRSEGLERLKESYEEGVFRRVAR